MHDYRNDHSPRQEVRRFWTLILAFAVLAAIGLAAVLADRADAASNQPSISIRAAADGNVLIVFSPPSGLSGSYEVLVNGYHRAEYEVSGGSVRRVVVPNLPAGSDITVLPPADGPATTGQVPLSHRGVRGVINNYGPAGATEHTVWLHTNRAFPIDATVLVADRGSVIPLRSELNFGDNRRIKLGVLHQGTVITVSWRSPSGNDVFTDVCKVNQQGHCLPGGD